MIRYALRCGNAHDFESWFASGAAYDTLRASGHVACPDCGDTNIVKALMAPRVPAKGNALTAPASDKETELAKLRDHVEQNSDYVGLNFAAEARAMHDGDKEARSIYGEAKPEEAKALIEEGVPVAPLPFVPRAKTN